MKKRIFLVLSLFITVILSANAQTTTITASKIYLDASGNLLSGGYFCLTPVNPNGQPTGFTAGSGGNVLPGQVCYPVTAGAISGVSVPDTADINPTGIGYLAQVETISHTLLYTLGTIFPTGSTWSLDAWSPNVNYTVPSTGLVYSTVTPSGRCSAPSITYTSTAQYSCVNQVWVVSSTGSGGSSFTPNTDLAGNSSDILVSGINDVHLASLGAGILKQTSMGIPEIAISGTDYSPAWSPNGDIGGSLSALTVVGLNGTNLAGLGAGLLKQNSSGIPSLAISGTDYLAPSGSAAIVGSGGDIVGTALSAPPTTGHLAGWSPTGLSDLGATLPSTSFPAITGDVNVSAGSTASTVVKVNGAALPASSACVGTNSSSQIVTATCGSGGSTFNGGTITAQLIIDPASASGVDADLAENSTTGLSSYRGNKGNGGDLWQWGANGSGQTSPSVMFFNDSTLAVTPLAIGASTSPNGGWLGMISTGTLGWTSSTEYPGTTSGPDTAFSRLAADSVALGNGTTGDYSGSLKLTNLTVTGTCTGCGSGSGSGTVSSGTSGQLAYYGATGTTISGVTTLPTAAQPAHTGDVTNTAGSLAMTVKGINGTILSGLSTGILKNTTSTGVPTIAVANTDYLAPGDITDASGTIGLNNTTVTGVTNLNIGTTATGTGLNTTTIGNTATQNELAVNCNSATTYCFAVSDQYLSMLTVQPGQVNVNGNLLVSGAQIYAGENSISACTGTVAIDPYQNSTNKCILTGNVTSTFSAPGINSSVNGGEVMTVAIKQTTGNSYTFTFPSSVGAVGGSTVTVSAGKESDYTFRWDFVDTRWVLISAEMNQ